MKKLTAIVFIGAMMLGTSCKKYLDINDNPNKATSATPELILPQALTTTASNLNSFNSYGAQLGGYSANAGGYGGFGTAISYNFSSSDFGGLWSAAYDNLEDYQAIINQAATQLPTYSYFYAAAKIMEAYNFELLVDAYNDIPFTNALQGANNLTPSYTTGPAIYVGLANMLDTAISAITAGQNATGVTLLGSSDVLFGGDVDLWKKFANTIKLRLIVRANGKATFTNTTFDAAGFLTTDALINPGFTRDNNRQNPAWSTWAYSYTGSDANKAWIPSTFIMGFYDGHKLTDPMRGSAIYYQYPSTGTNQLGVESVNTTKCPSGSFWYSSTNRDGKSAGSSIGILKGPDAGYPAMLAAESYFLQSEAVVRGILTSGDAKTLFNSGIAASFNYLYQGPDGTVTGTPTADAATYQADNASSYLANFDLASGTSQQIEAIITQKYIALNYISSQEAWNDYRRTLYPSITYAAVPDPHQTFASTVSESTRPDKLPSRILYPSSEGAYNPANVPKGISPFTSLIFWAQ